MELFGPLQANQIEINQMDLEKLNIYIKALEKWNNIHALTSVSAREIPYVFVVEPMAAARELLKIVSPQRCLDIGTGFGNPGVGMSVYFKKTEFLLIDSSQKKTALLRQVIDDAKLERIKVMTARVEDIVDKVGNAFDLVISRGIGPLERTLDYAYRFANDNGIVAIFKARLDIPEFKNMKRDDFVFDRVITLNILYPGLEISRYLLIYRKHKA